MQLAGPGDRHDPWVLREALTADDLSGITRAADAIPIEGGRYNLALLASWAATKVEAASAETSPNDY